MDDNLTLQSSGASVSTGPLEFPLPSVLLVTVMTRLSARSGVTGYHTPALMCTRFRAIRVPCITNAFLPVEKCLKLSPESTLTGSTTTVLVERRD